MRSNEVAENSARVRGDERRPTPSGMDLLSRCLDDDDLGHGDPCLKCEFGKEFLQFTLLLLRAVRLRYLYDAKLRVCSVSLPEKVTLGGQEF